LHNSWRVLGGLSIAHSLDRSDWELLVGSFDTFLVGWGPNFIAIPDISLMTMSAGIYYPAYRVASAMSVNSVLGYTLSLVSIHLASMMLEWGFGWFNVFAIATIFGIIGTVAGIATIRAEKVVRGN